MGIPLPALAVRTQQTSPIEQVGQILGLRSLIDQQRTRQLQQTSLEQENQARDLQFQTQQRQAQEGQLVRQAFSEEAKADPQAAQSDLWDRATKKLAQNANVSPATIQQLGLHAQDLRSKTAAADEATLRLRDVQINNLRGAYKTNVYDAPDDKKAAGWQQTLAMARANPQAYGDLSRLNIPEQFPGKEAGEFLMQSMTGLSNQIKEGQEGRAAAKTAAETRGSTAEAGLREAQLAAMQGGGAAGTDLAAQEANAYLKANPGKTLVDYQKWKATLAPQAQINVGMAAGGGLQTGAMDQAAERYFTTGQLPPGNRGVAGLAQNRAIMNRASELHPGESLTGASAEYQANRHSLENLQKNFDQLTAFEKTAGRNLEQFLGTAQKVVDTGIPLINTPVRLVTGQMGGKDQAAFDAARTVALTEIAKVLTNPGLSGQLSDAARHEVESLSPKNANLAQIVRVANVLKTDMENRRQSYQEQIDDIRGRLRTPFTPGARTLSMAQIEQAAKDHGVSVDEAKKQATAAGYTVK